MKQFGILPKSFYNRAPEVVAQELLGKLLIHKINNQIVSGIIVETESYGGKNDPASHAYKKKTERNKIMFHKPGTAYIYLCYGMYYLMNIITMPEGVPAAVLLRALEPFAGIEIMHKNRNTKNIFNLTNGPGKLTMALGIDKNFNDKSVCRGELIIRDTDVKNFNIVRRTRIGINVGKEELLRFYIEKNKFISKE